MQPSIPLRPESYCLPYGAESGAGMAGDFDLIRTGIVATGGVSCMATDCGMQPHVKLWSPEASSSKKLEEFVGETIAEVTECGPCRPPNCQGNRYRSMSPGVADRAETRKRD